MNKNKEIKSAAIVTLLSISFIYITVEHNLPTNYFRDTFFYADKFVSDKIILNGQTPDIESINVPNEWGKIGTQVRLPLLPIHLVITHLISGVSISTLYTTVPMFLLMSFALFILCQGMGISILPSTIFALAGGVAAPATAFYTIAFSSVSQAALYLGVIAILIYERQSDPISKTTTHKVVAAIPLLALSLFLFYRYPPSFLIIILILLFSNIISFLQNRRPLFPIAIFITLLLIGYQVFTIPLPAYVSSFQSVAYQVIHLEFANPSTAGSFSYPTAYSPTRFSLLPLPVLFPLSLLGGALCLNESRSGSNLASTIAVAWGITAIFVSVIYFANATSWLIGRSFFLALPVLILGAARGTLFLSSRTTQTNLVEVLLPLLVLFLVISSVGLQLSSPSSQIKSYEPGIAEGAQWSGSYIEDEITTDHKLGAPMAAEGNFNVKYPRSYPEVESIFYTTNYSDFADNASEYMILSKGMTEYGIRVLESDHIPISEEAFETRESRSKKIYSNGEVVVINTNVSTT